MMHELEVRLFPFVIKTRYHRLCYRVSSSSSFSFTSQSFQPSRRCCGHFFLFSCFPFPLALFFFFVSLFLRRLFFFKGWLVFFLAFWNSVTRWLVSERPARKSTERQFDCIRYGIRDETRTKNKQKKRIMKYKSKY